MAKLLVTLMASLAALFASRTSTGQAVVILPLPAHVLNRITYGPSLALLQSLSLQTTGGPSNVDIYIGRQIALSGNENALTNNLLAQLPTPRTTIQQVQQEQYIRACFSQFQLREVMTQFWERHFNTNFLRVRAVVTSPGFGGTEADAVGMIADENSAFRTHALGRFEDLLLTSIDSRAMILYLSLFNSRSGPGANDVPNEDLAREFLELHTLGPEEGGQANYSHDDIEALAECLAGWNVYRGSLPGGLTYREPVTGNVIPNPSPLQRVFIEQWHESGQALTLDFDPTTTADDLALTTTSTTDIDARTVATHVANMEQTKRFVCRKLIRFFLSDDANEPTLLTQAMAAWGTNGGDIAAVLDVILTSTEFQGTTYRWQKARTPMEAVCFTVRALDGTASSPSNVDAVIRTAELMGQTLHEYPSPDGYPTESLQQPGTQVYLTFVQYALDFLRNQAPHAGIIIHDIPGLAIQGVPNLVPGGDPDDPGDVAEFFLRRLYVDRYTQGDVDRLTDFVSKDIFGNTAPLDHVGAPQDYRNRIHLLAALAVAIPQGLKK